MHKMNRDRPDLNLLVVFDAVARTGSVTKAADILALSQPAISHALNRLRDLVGDPLFVRSREGLVPTPRAAKMMAPVSGVLQSARTALADERFDPLTSTAIFRVGVSDYAALTTVPKLVRALRSHAPNARLELSPVDDRTLEKLESGALDCTFWGAPPPGAPFREQELYRERFVGIMCQSHPLARRDPAKRITLKEYLAFPHVMVAFRDQHMSPVDEALAKIGRKRNTVITTPGFGSIMALLPGSDLVAALPSWLSEATKNLGLKCFDLPIAVPEFSYSLVWHRRKDSDQACSWLRRIIFGELVGM